MQSSQNKTQHPESEARSNAEVLEAWDLGVATMKPGERSVFTVHPSLAFGEEGAGEEQN